MAANSKSIQGIASLRKRVTQIWTANSARSASVFTARRTVQTEAYNKNLDDQVHPSVVPDYVIQPQSDKYWEPHPQTGVFGPASEQTSAVGKERGFATSTVESSVLEEKAWFRPTSIEDLEKPSSA